MTKNNDFINDYMDENEILINEICQAKNLSSNTKRIYRQTITQYTSFHDMSMHNLIDEADREEEERVRLKRRKIKNRILSFKQYLLESGRQDATINSRINTLMATYHFFEIETPRIQRLPDRRVETIHDIPTREDIRTALNTTTNLGMRAVILFMVSSGTSKREVLDLTIQDFIDATAEYHHEINIHHVVDVLLQREDVVPTFSMHRQKTHTNYYTFCTPEATRSICLYLRSRMDGGVDIRAKNGKIVDGESKLFHFTYDGLTRMFQRLNDKLCMGRVGSSRFFHAHAMRKFFATELLKSDMDSMNIDFFSGRSISSTHQAYFKADPERLKQKYIHFMKNLSIFEEIEIKELNSDEKEELEYYRQKDVERDVKIQRLEDMIRRLK